MSQRNNEKKDYYSHLSEKSLKAAKKIEKIICGLSISEVESLLYAVEKTLKEKTKVLSI